MPLHRQSRRRGLNELARAAMSAMRAFRPRDEIEGMLAAQAVALHPGGDGVLSPIDAPQPTE
jgi:hypothetical protein